MGNGWEMDGKWMGNGWEMDGLILIVWSRLIGGGDARSVLLHADESGWRGLARLAGGVAHGHGAAQRDQRRVGGRSQRRRRALVDRGAAH